MHDVWAHPQLQARDRWREVDSPAGKIPALLPPGSWEEQAPRMDAVPALGQHTDASWPHSATRRPDRRNCVPRRRYEHPTTCHIAAHLPVCSWQPARPLRQGIRCRRRRRDHRSRRRGGAAKTRTRARSAIADWCASQQGFRQRIVVRINDDGVAMVRSDLALLRSAGIRARCCPRPNPSARLTASWRCLRQPDASSASSKRRAACSTSRPSRRPAACNGWPSAPSTMRVDLDLSGDDARADLPGQPHRAGVEAAGLASPIAGVTADLTMTTRCWPIWRLRGPVASAQNYASIQNRSPRCTARWHPAADEVDMGQRVIAAAQAGPGAVQVDGKMVDRPVLLKARAILERHTD